MATGIRLNVRDAKGAGSNTTIYVPDTADFDDVMEFGAALAQLWANMCTGVVERVSVTFEVDVSGLAGNTMDANSDVEEGARFAWLVAGGYTASNRIATFDESKMVSGTNQVDTGDPDVAQFVSYMEDGFTATSTNVVSPTDYRDDDITDLASAQESFQKTRKVS